MTKKEIEKKRIETATKKKPVSKPVDNLLVLVLVLDRRTGKVVSFKECNSFSNNKVTVDNSVDNHLEDCIKFLDKQGYDAYRRK